MSFYTPLRYPGGKRKLLHFFKALIAANHLDGCSYIEPYAGGAGLAMSLLFEGAVSSIHINDKNYSIYAFWHSVLNSTEDLCRKIYDTPVTIEEWRRQKAIQATPQLFSNLELGFSTFFLNRTNRSGILKGGVIGGKKQDGEWKLDARFTKSDLVKRIQAIANRQTQIQIDHKDAINYVKNIKKGLSNIPALFYFDPPYFEKGAELYDNFYEKKDHAKVSRCIKKLHSPWVVSYDNHPAIQALYRGCKAITYSLNYTAQDKKRGAEFMAFSDSLSLPFWSAPRGRFFSLMYDLEQIA
jgi:DNA adenine methylase